MGKVAIVVNGSEKTNVYPAFTLAAAAAASGDDVIFFFTPSGAEVLRKGVLEGMTGKGLPPMADLLEGVMALGGRMILCELALAAKDLTEEELRDDIEISGATTFMVAATDANNTYTF